MKRVLFVIAIIICLLVINGLIHSIYNLWNKQDLILKAHSELDKAKKENQTLKQQLAQAQSPEFIEEQARNKLFMVKPNEQEIIIPQSKNTNKGSIIPISEPNWKQWIKLFF